MTKCGSKLCLTHGTVLSGGTGGLSTGSVSECGSELYLTYGTKLSIGTGSLSTGGMAKRVTVGLSTSRAGLGGSTGRIYPGVTVGLTVGKSAEQTDSRCLTGRGEPGVRTKLCAHGNLYVLGYVFNLDGIGLEAVCYRSADDLAVTELKRILKSYHNVEDSVVTVLYKKSVAKEGLATLVCRSYGNGIANVGRRDLALADVAKTVFIFVQMVSDIRLCTTRTFVIVEGAVLDPFCSKLVNVRRLLLGLCRDLILESEGTGRERE